jgi:hypothetical protein
MSVSPSLHALDCVLVLSNRGECMLGNVVEQKTVVFFTSVGSARRFLQFGGLTEHWHLARMTARDAVDPLLRAARDGAQKAIIDPDFDSDQFVTLPLPAVVEELQKFCMTIAARRRGARVARVPRTTAGISDSRPADL